MASKYPMRVEVARARLSALGTTQLALAKECDVDVRTVQRWFAGQPVRLDEAERVAAALQLGTAELFEGVPEENLAAKLSRIGPLQRAVVTRDGVIAQVLRTFATHHAVDLLEPVSFRAHPSRGFVYKLETRPAMLDGFVVLRVDVGVPSAVVRVIQRLTRSMLYERARISLRPGAVELVENHFVRSVRSSRRPDGSLELWAWTGGDIQELILASDAELKVSQLPAPPDRTTFDMTASETTHAVCIRPTFGQLVAARLPSGFDRVLNRDDSRLDGPPLSA